MPSPWSSRTLGVVGGGNMAEALVHGILAARLLQPENIAVYDILPERRALFEAKGCRPAATPESALQGDAVLLAVKPQNITDALAGLRDGRGSRLFISIAAGVTTGTLESLLPAGTRVIRVMPNTPLLVGKGVAALAPGKLATEDDMDAALALFACAGDAVRVDEAAMDAVTALSGSGPAYVFRFAEALFAAGEEMGLSPDLSRRLAIGTIHGAAEMLDQNNDAAALRRQVTSPGGTTAAALNELEADGFEPLLKKALQAAKARSAELGRGT